MQLLCMDDWCDFHSIWKECLFDFRGIWNKLCLDLMDRKLNDLALFIQGTSSNLDFIVYKWISSLF